MRMRGLYESLDSAVIPETRPSTLVIYVFSKTDPEYERNLQFFVQHGMWEDDGCDYAIIVQQVMHSFHQGRPVTLLMLTRLRKSARILLYTDSPCVHFSHPHCIHLQPRATLRCPRHGLPEQLT